MLLIVLICITCSLTQASVTWSEDDSYATIANGYSYIRFNKQSSSIDRIAADFTGAGGFIDTDENLLALPLALSVEETPSELNTAPNKAVLTSSAVEWLLQTEEEASFQVTITADGMDGVQINETWTVAMQSNYRDISVSFEGAVTRDGSIKYALHGLYFTMPSLYGFFDRGALQMMGKTNACMGTGFEPFDRIYALGDGGAMDITYQNLNGAQEADTTSRNNAKESNNDKDNGLDQSVRSSFVLRSASTSVTGFASGFENILLGEFPNKSRDFNTAWNAECWSNSEAVTVSTDMHWKLQLNLVPNNYDFPVLQLNDVTEPASTTPTTGAVSQGQEDFDALRSRFTAIYASPVGCLQSYYDNRSGTIAPTISAPEVGYSPDTNFFDPDNFISLSAMLYSGDPYLIRQVKAVLSRTAETMCGIGRDQLPSYCGFSRERVTHDMTYHARFLQTKRRLASSSSTSTSSSAANSTSRTGQLMHHYVDLVPTYESIAGSEQLGPNIFWTLSVFRYISLTQDTDFATRMFPYIDLSTEYVLTFFDEEKGLLSAPGPLWIDVLVRENYTSDSNAMVVPLLRETAEFYNLMDADPEFAQSLNAVADTISSNMVDLLWNKTSNDHFITQLNPDGTTRDFVDYDANLIVVAFNVLNDEEKIQSLLKRVDNGEFTHVRGTWCSEQAYTGDAEDCYIVGGDVCGDSVVTLARIGWVDALARKRVRDSQTLYDLLLNPLQQDLIRDVWLYERYDANAEQIRTPNYFEYPSLVAMMQWEVVYGIEVGLQHLSINPLPYRPFTFAVGSGGSRVLVRYSSLLVELMFPGGGYQARKGTSKDTADVNSDARLSSDNTQQKQEQQQEQLSSVATTKSVYIYGMHTNTRYAVRNSCDDAVDDVTAVFTDEIGLLSFSAYFGTDCIVSAARLPL